VTRSLQLTQKASKQEFKTLESAVQTYNQNGEVNSLFSLILLQKISQSFRCADVDKEIPELMGISKPILENVIFCHQEDSNWPLAEPSVLKKKFDDIFAATKYI
jgi:DNA repair protein RAD50